MGYYTSTCHTYFFALIIKVFPFPMMAQDCLFIPDGRVLPERAHAAAGIATDVMVRIKLDHGRGYHVQIAFQLYLPRRLFLHSFFLFLFVIATSCFLQNWHIALSGHKKSTKRVV